MGGTRLTAVCRCGRCEDPTELGTMLSAMLCRACGGAVLPASPGLPSTTWRCGECGAEEEAGGVETEVRECEASMMDISETETEKYEQLLARLRPRFHRHHFQQLLTKLYLARSLQGRLTRQQLERKVSLYREYMAVFAVVDPGLTKWRGSLLYETAKLSLMLGECDLKQGRCSEHEFLAGVEQAGRELEEAVRCLQWEQVGSEEHQQAGLAAASLHQTRDLLTLATHCKQKQQADSKHG